MRERSRTNDDGSRARDGEHGARPVERTVAPRLRPSSRLTHGGLLALQRWAGNRFVTGLIQRQPPPTAAPEAPLKDRYEAAVKAGNWSEAAVLLNGFNDADIQQRVNALSPAERASMRKATPEWAHRVRTPLLDLDYKAAVAAGNWNEAAVLLNGFNDADIAARVSKLGTDQLAALKRAAVAQLGGGAGRLVKAIEQIMSTTYGDAELKVKGLVAAGKHDEALQYICATYGFGGGNFEIKVVPPIPGAWATASGEIKEGAKQTLSIGKNLFAEDFPFIVRTIGHEFQHLKQRSQKDPIKNQKEREFLAWAWEALDESVPKYTLAVAAVHAKKAIEYYNDMPADRKTFHADLKKQLDALIAKAGSTP